MKRNFTLIVLFLQTLLLPLMAQTVLTNAANSMHVGDVLTLKGIDTISPGNAGANQVWDYSGTKIEENFVINYNADASKTSVAGSEFFACDENGGRNVFFKITPTQSLYYGLSADKAVINFTTPLVEMTYPFAYGSEINGAMNGSYTENGLTVPITGTYSIKGDAWGTLVLPNGVKLNNVLRVKSMREYDQEASGSDYHFIVNRYAFYAPGSRYAVLQIKDATYKCSCGCNGKDYKAYFNPTAGGAQVEQPAPQSTNPSFTYKVYPNPFENELKIDYEIKAKAKIEISVVDITGKVVKTILNTTQEAGSYNISTDMSACHASNFILRILVNDVLYTDKLIKKENCSKK